MKICNKAEILFGQTPCLSTCRYRRPFSMASIDGGHCGHKKSYVKFIEYNKIMNKFHIKEFDDILKELE